MIFRWSFVFELLGKVLVKFSRLRRFVATAPRRYFSEGLWNLIDIRFHHGMRPCSRDFFIRLERTLGWAF